MLMVHGPLIERIIYRVIVLIQHITAQMHMSPNLENYIQGAGIISAYNRLNDHASQIYRVIYRALILFQHVTA